MNNRQSRCNLGAITALIAVLALSYYLLLKENILHSSISCIMNYSHHFTNPQHVVILGLLPIYIALMIFGAAIGGIYLGSRLEFLLIRTIYKK